MPVRDWGFKSLLAHQQDQPMQLLIFIIRTAGNPLHSRPRLPLTITTLAVVIVGIVLPYSPLAQLLGFVPLPGWYFVFLAIVVGTYLLLVEFVKRRLMAKLVDLASTQHFN